ncbi:MAG TPA: hypothetical protein VFU72_04145, partial [Nitrolancea sp.]|nr:hypothetical protein [Nitrolancea sp.]
MGVRHTDSSTPADAGKSSQTGQFSRYRRLLTRYLRPEWPRVLLLALIIGATIGVQVAAPLVGSRFVDHATAGAPL